MEETIEKLKQQARESWRGDIGEGRARALEQFLRGMLAEYSAAFGVAEADLLAAFEARRDYTAINYYQRANFPSLDGVRVFETAADLLASMPSRRFRCPACKGESKSAYTCDTGLEIAKGKVCDWKSHGFFRAQTRVTVRTDFLADPFVDCIFTPVEWE